MLISWENFFELSIIKRLHWYQWDFVLNILLLWKISVDYIES